MTPGERAAFRAGIETARQMALVAAITIEVRDDAPDLRQQSAVAALQGLADGLRMLMREEPLPCTASAFADAIPTSTMIDSTNRSDVLG